MIGSVVVAVIVAVAGCHQNPEPPRQFVPGDPLYDQFTTRGDRAVIDTDDGPTLKIRRRSQSTRIYDADMIPVGQVRVDDAGDVECQRLDDSHHHTARFVDDGVARLKDGWRLEQTDEGWDVFDADASLIALLRDRDDRWTLRPTDGDAVSWSVDRNGDQRRVVDANDRVVVHTRSDDFGELELLVLALESLAPLQRYSLALWADTHL